MLKQLKFYTKILFLLLVLFSCSPPAEIQGEEQVFRLCFEASCMRELLIQEINASHTSIKAAVYGFSDKEITEALINAVYRGVKISLISDYDSENHWAFQRLLELKYRGDFSNLIHIKFGNNAGIMHNKYWIFDKHTIITGSTNLTDGLDSHFNNMIGIKSPSLAHLFLSDFTCMQEEGLFASAKNSCTQPYDWIYQENSIQNLQIQALFTPYKAHYPPVYFDDPETPIVDPLELNYSNALGAKIIPLLENAQKSIWVLAFSLTDKIFVHYLEKAFLRGVKVRVWMDRGQFNSSYSHSGARIEQLAKTISFLKITAKSGGLLHHKVIIIDDNIVVLGSLNFSVAAVTSNDENFLIIKNAHGLAKAFYKEMAKIDGVSRFLINPQ